MQKNKLIQGSGKFFIGCNYWASHAGTAMWSDWRTAVIEADFRRLSEEGIEILRVFPLWPYFQPIHTLYGGGGYECEIRFGEDIIPYTESGRAGVSEVAMKRFEELTEIAKRYNLKLIVGLITGFMSGRLFVPPALEGKDIITDKTAIMWQVRFVKHFVRTFKNCDVIVAWDLGNECNNMQSNISREDAWVWTNSLSGAVKTEDSTRALISGMHSLTPKGIWTMQDQGELTDILTTHPYPFWTPYSDYDPVNTIRPILHATAESLFYANLGHKPCFAEEIGTMGPMVASEEVSASFARASLFSLWAHDCHGFLWWCANDQTELSHAPYDWVSCERELGLLKVNGDAKPVLREMSAFKRNIDTLPFDVLPPRITEGVCILNSSQNHWAVAYSSFILAKQAGFDIEFQFEDEPIKRSELYLLPCVSGVAGIKKHKWVELLDRVEEGAVLYISIVDGYIADFEKVTGLKVNRRYRRNLPSETIFTGSSLEYKLSLKGPIILELESITAEILGKEPSGNPIFTCSKYGKGKIYFMALPVEMNVIESPGVLNNAEEEPYWKVYESLVSEFKVNRVIKKNHPQLGVTEHIFQDGSRVAILINYSPENLRTTIHLSEGWGITDTFYGNSPIREGSYYKCGFEANNAIILKLDAKK